MSLNKPEKIEELLIERSCIENLLNLNPYSDNILLTGRSGVGKTLICRIFKKNYEKLNYYENVDKNFIPNSPSIATSNDIKIQNNNFNKIIEIIPLNKLVLLKKLITLHNYTGFNQQKTLYKCIDKFYPNINKIISEYTNENSILL
jgi:hypothetical protein